jgi:preprotein translocase subunit SecE
MMAVAERLSATDRLRKFIGEVKVEITKVSWPSRDELREATVVVIVAVFIISIFIYAMDLMIGRIVQAVL